MNNDLSEKLIELKEKTLNTLDYVQSQIDKIEYINCSECFYGSKSAADKIHIMGIYNALQRLSKKDREAIERLILTFSNNRATLDSSETDRGCGHWEIDEDGIVCSVCFEHNLETNYCPNCGADMSGRNKNEVD